MANVSGACVRQEYRTGLDSASPRAARWRFQATTRPHDAVCPACLTMSTPAASRNGTPEPTSPEVGRSPVSGVAAGGARRRLSARWLVLGTCLGLMGSCLAGLYWFNRPAQPLPPLLTQERLDEAWQRWRERGPESYHLEVDVQGDVGGKVVLDVRDGHTPSQKRTWGYWTVPNQLGVLETDLAHAQNTHGAFRNETSPAELRAEFDSEYGYPSRYQRMSLGGMGVMSWQITRFEPLTD